MVGEVVESLHEQLKDGYVFEGGTQWREEEKAHVGEVGDEVPQHSAWKVYPESRKSYHLR